MNTKADAVCMNPECEAKENLVAANLIVQRHFGVKRSHVGVSEMSSVDDTFVEMQEQMNRLKPELSAMNGIEREELEPLDIIDTIPAVTKIGFTTVMFKPSTSPAKSESREIIPMGKVRVPAPVLPPIGAVKRRELCVNMIVYAMRSVLSIWYKAKIVEILDTPEGRQHRVRIEMKGRSSQLAMVLPAKHLAYVHPSEVILPVGTRIIAKYKDENWHQQDSMYAGIIAEPPKIMNKYRYLIFFDDGFAQYTSHEHIYLVCEESKDVADDIHPDSKDFIRSYLKQYPERPMVKLQRGQVIFTEWNGKWWVARVADVDASLVKMYFDADKRTEWIYRGSTRLRPLYNELSNAEANKAAMQGKLPKFKRHGLIRSNKRNEPYVEYTRGLDDPRGEREQTAVTDDAVIAPSDVDLEGELQERKQIARKHTAPRVNIAKKSTAACPVPARKEVVYQRSECDGTYQAKLTQRLDRRQSYSPHRCSPNCLPEGSHDLNKHKGSNPLMIPMLCGWERQITKYQTSGKRVLFYRSPCGRRLRDMKEVRIYLEVTSCSFPVDLFCFNVQVHCYGEFVPTRSFCNILDISYGKENIPVSCVNSINRVYPEYVEYSTERLPAKGVKINQDPEFLVGCECKGDCNDFRKCACQQLTIDNFRRIYPKGGREWPPGYKHRRLNEQVISGIYECNSRCSCSKRCQNRVVQNGLQLRLQVFKTDQCGWGLRCLDDLPKGCFVCIYAGQLLTEQEANEDGAQFGDEYLAELDHIEVCERIKEGYESDVIEPELEEKGYGRDSPESGDEYNPQCDTEITNVPSSESEFEANLYEQVAPRKRSSRRKTIESEKKSVVPPITEDNSQKPKETESEPDIEIQEEREKQFAAKPSRFKALPDPKLNTSMVKQTGMAQFGTRKYFGDDYCYIMDAKTIGNIGRYFNHSCSPNLFVQNVFVDTHDIRFPWVSFFAADYIRAGTELTWDYSYDVGAVADKCLYCHCGS
uniref:Histone-lysine N-methyltransferase n=1 Tax=Strigamia maritima TaxID=126957 RepID=T1IYR1_STRMM